MSRNFDDFKKFINNKKTAVVGIGISNRPLINFLLELGAEVTAFDKKTKDEIGDAVNEFTQRGVKLVLGKNYLDFLEGYKVIFKTPSMRIDSPALVKAKKSGAYITSEMEEFVKYCPAKIIGVTGSDGKTTTTTLIYNILKEEGYKTWVGGNIGTPLFANITDISEKDRVVLELSSFQLMTMDVSPQISVITNLSPNHLDIHKDMDEYVNAKKNIYRFQNKDDLLVVNRDNAITAYMINEAKGKVMEFSRKCRINNGAYFSDGKLYILQKFVCNKEDIIIKGMHNVENFLAAFCATVDDASIESMKKIATTFSGVEHRAEFVRELNGVKYYNDSIASSPTRTLASLRAFERKVILIAGGYDKNIPFEPLAEQGLSMIKKLILLGNTKDKIENTFSQVMNKRQMYIPIIKVNTLEEAINTAKNEASEGDIVTLSPSCASFDMFPNFEVRGNKFKEIVKKMK
ncbi:UDP-N-acetylmuramoylalanine--D-glutamate ligase [Clostridium pasteurianum DSM 525 = ATCC 6013]|uniref:UDP-N-acetylmuramoylalanine--D-glutamate ligase n=1 Tax=Clostridium pasteurianum DSM 525 = ATCC 6013 TaxID=1262449 RepID=A0A0H3J8I1_CLOPA|nr:UDP-N-acetylmuramoyl-L-alanine--D-glutamate ligase [Clostridium pasteurianum]AJA49764.1 UDP-N-acetylmuramoylalanine--D-glutamate ligase [Clostridium pasteurianum DSM 525 = ATCC 6013]AJA53752.1 UDP-N-acetylmuramoylalanine--D-glutamate ligase [Clostridium pasteurianum DSM 525 = ATCC 6013]AOZ76914.1 UDP-N-acetylmuramoylalanine--D-glutamate ligase [Clostridium pasteurianum DSM 525 = ATCC 6013]AOZ80711.1 UDP-N-acetylmuramoylalanine--D-glutamate ligase [Clostridium pasteurianum]ELP57730.1 UDP-N-a